MNGLTKIGPIAAPPARSIATCWVGPPFRAKIRAPRPVPRAISGASGPSTAPKTSVPIAARRKAGAVRWSKSK